MRNQNRNQNRHQRDQMSSGWRDPERMPMHDRSNNRAASLSGPNSRSQEPRESYYGNEYRSSAQGMSRDNSYEPSYDRNYSQSYGPGDYSHGNSEPAAFDANYGSSRWGSGRRDRYDATRMRDENYDNESYGYQSDRVAGNQRPQFQQRHSMNHANSYNDEFDHDYENRSRHSGKEERWSQNNWGPQGRQSRDTQGYNYEGNQPQRQGRDYAQRADRDQERFESDSIQDQYRGNQRNRDHYY